MVLLRKISYKLRKISLFSALFSRMRTLFRHEIIVLLHFRFMLSNKAAKHNIQRFNFTSKQDYYINFSRKIRQNSIFDFFLPLLIAEIIPFG